MLINRSDSTNLVGSGKGPEIYKLFDFTADGVASRAEKTINYYKGKQLLSPMGRAF